MLISREGLVPPYYEVDRERILVPTSARTEFITNSTSRQTQENCTNDTK